MYDRLIDFINLRHASFTYATTLIFQLCIDNCMSTLVHTFFSHNLLDFEVTGGD